MTAREIKKLERAAEPAHRSDRSDRADVQLDAETTVKVVESMVIRGDISALSPAERSRYYVQMCESLGLNPAAQPFAILRLNGKEVLYPTRGATDQLAAIHRLNREIIDGPKVIDLGGTKLVYAQCRATHPNGRVETAVATLPLTDPVNVLMKAETKAKRRATLSILGLAMLDETELDTIPAHAKAPATPIELPDGGSVPSALPAQTTPSGSDAEDRPAPAEAEVAQPAAEALPPALAAFQHDAEQIELPGEAVSVWVKHRGELASLPAPDREAAWKALCKRTEEVGKMKNAKVWLKRAIAEEDARRQQTPENNQFG